MPYLICRKCNGYYELQKDESLEDFESCMCKGEIGICRKYQINILTMEIQKLKRIIKWIYIISAASVIIILLIFFYFNYLISLIMDYSVPLSFYWLYLRILDSF